MKVRCYIDYEIDTDHLDPKFVDVKGFAVDEALHMLSDEVCPDLFTAEVIENEHLYFDKPTQLKVEEIVDTCNDLYYYGAIGFQDKIICMDNGHVHPTSAVGDYLTIIERYAEWLNLSDEVIGN